MGNLYFFTSKGREGRKDGGKGKAGGRRQGRGPTSKARGEGRVREGEKGRG